MACGCVPLFSLVNPLQISGIEDRIVVMPVECYVKSVALLSQAKMSDRKVEYEHLT